MSVAFSPTGGLLATANWRQQGVGVLGRRHGALTPVDGLPVPHRLDPASVTFSPTGGLLATANPIASTVSVFSVQLTAR